MSERINIFQVKITNIAGDPPMDSASLEGTLLLNGSPWPFKSECDEITADGVYDVVGEKTQDERGRYLRIHRIFVKEVNY